MGVFRSSDGFVNLATTLGRMWRVFCKMLSLDALLEDPRFETNQQRVKHREALIELIESKTTQKNTGVADYRVKRDRVPVWTNIHSSRSL